MSIDPVERLQAGFGHAVYIVDQAFVHDNILPAAEAGGGALAGGGIGKLSSTLMAARLTGAAGPTGSRIVYESPIGPVLPAAEGAYGSTFKAVLSDIRGADFGTPKNGSVFWTGFREGITVTGATTPKLYN